LETQFTHNQDVDLESLIIRVRCPGCLKLYAVDASEIDQPKPKFNCAKCQTQFWFPFPESLGSQELLGFPVDWMPSGQEKVSGEVKVESTPSVQSSEIKSETIQNQNSGSISQYNEARLFHCPRCEAEYRGGDNECPKCGVVFAKLEISSEGAAITASPALRKLWHAVIDQYSNPQSHRRFVDLAQKEKNLLYASQQYGRLLKAHAGDETAMRMKKEIIALSEAVLGLTPKTSNPRRWRKLMPRMTTFVLIMGGAMIAMGFMISAARNLIGLGVAVVFFTLAVDWLFSNN
jgi:transposase-like protein